MSLAIVGCGMGDPDLLTGEARRTLSDADVVVGSRRAVRALPAECPAERHVRAVPEAIAALVMAHPEWKNVAIALGGDVGFYSAAKKLLVLLADREPTLVCGVSTPQYFAARLARPWQDLRLVSAHGQTADVLAEVLNHPHTLFLTGGAATPAAIVDELCFHGLADAAVTVGENLSLPDERIVRGRAGELRGREYAPLSVVLVDNPRTFARAECAPGFPDDEFVRGEAPMTKREVRVNALSLLRIGREGVVYDVGAGTGSVAVESALIARRGRVYAVESNPGAMPALEANKAKFGVYNLMIVPGTAPEALHDLPPPDAAFVGGSGGRLPEIVRAVTARNPRVRLVVAAITLETLSAALDAFQKNAVPNAEVCQIAASRARAAGTRHLLEAMNPVFLIAGGGRT